MIVKKIFTQDLQIARSLINKDESAKLARRNYSSLQTPLFRVKEVFNIIKIIQTKMILNLWKKCLIRTMRCEPV